MSNSNSAAIGRTTRTVILPALTALSANRSVIVVANPAAVAFEIAERIVELAAVMAIPAALSESNIIDHLSDTPLVYTRPFGWEAVMLRRGDPHPHPLVLIDHSAAMERGVMVTPQLRSVALAGLDDEEKWRICGDGEVDTFATPGVRI